MKRIFLIVAAVFFLNSANTFGQLRENDNLLGASLGLWVSPGTPSLGMNFEHQVTQLGNVASLGIGGVLRYTSWSDRYPYDDYYDYNYTTVGFQTNFNFNNIGEGRFVPFAGAVLGYNYINNSYVNRSGRIYTATYSSGWWMWLQGGFRWFFSPSVAGGVRIGTGNFNFSVLELSMDFRL